MPTSSSDRCTRISPSAILDDRLDGKDLEWARDHLRRCEACRERVEDFREMLLRVGRLPKATVGATAMDEAYTRSVPERLRDEAGVRFESGAADTSRPMPPMGALRADGSTVPDLMIELEREIFRDEPSHPTQLDAERIYPTMAPPGEDEVARDEPVIQGEPEFDAPAAEAPAWREVPLDSHQVPQPAANDSGDADWQRLLDKIANAPESDEAAPPSNWFPTPDELPGVAGKPGPAEAISPAEAPGPAGASASQPQADAARTKHDAWAEPELAEPPAGTNVIFDHEPALSFDEPAEPALEAAPRRPRSETVMRLAVGLGAAACVLLAALLYEGGYFFKGHPTASLAPTASASVSVRPSTSRSASPSASARPTATPAPKASAPPANVLFTLGNGDPGATVFRIREGTAVAGFTRLVFDMHGDGLPSMIISQSDPTHVEVMFMNTTLGNVAVRGLASYQVSNVEPGVQTGPNTSFVIELARPVKITAFTLPASGSYAWRLVVDLHSI